MSKKPPKDYPVGQPADSRLPEGHFLIEMMKKALETRPATDQEKADLAVRGETGPDTVYPRRGSARHAEMIRRTVERGTVPADNLQAGTGKNRDERVAELFPEAQHGVVRAGKDIPGAEVARRLYGTETEQAEKLKPLREATDKIFNILSNADLTYVDHIRDVFARPATEEFFEATNNVTKAAKKRAPTELKNKLESEKDKVRAIALEGALQWSAKKSTGQEAVIYKHLLTLHERIEALESFKSVLGASVEKEIYKSRKMHGDMVTKLAANEPRLITKLQAAIAAVRKDIDRMPELETLKTEGSRSHIPLSLGILLCKMAMPLLEAKTVLDDELLPQAKLYEEALKYAGGYEVREILRIASESPPQRDI